MLQQLIAPIGSNEIMQEAASGMLQPHIFQLHISKVIVEKNEFIPLQVSVTSKGDQKPLIEGSWRVSFTKRTHSVDLLTELSIEEEVLCAEGLAQGYAERESTEQRKIITLMEH